MNDFYNTIQSGGTDLAEKKAKARSQQEKILLHFLEFPNALCTPFDIQRIVLPQAPITSVRRAMTNLTEDGFLEKTDKQRAEQYGTVNYCWKLKSKSDQNQLKLF